MGLFPPYTSTKNKAYKCVNMNEIICVKVVIDVLKHIQTYPAMTSNPKVKHKKGSYSTYF